MNSRSNSLRPARILAAFVGASALAGCAGDTDTALFFTHTIIGIDADSAPPGIGIGYDRTEGYIGPRMGNGEVPPVVAALESDSSFFGNNTRQVYAAGDAALIVQGEDVGDSDGELKGDEKRMMFFGTTTSVGLKAVFGQATPNSFTFGYKRRELSVLPLAKTDDDTYEFPSVIASIDSTGRAESVDGTKVDLLQFFGTGRAAEKLAENSAVKKVFERVSENALGVSATAAASCYLGLAHEIRRNVWKNANEANLISDAVLKAANDRYDMAKAETGGIHSAAGAAHLRRADQIYAGALITAAGDSANRAAWNRHNNDVCAAAKMLG